MRILFVILLSLLFLESPSFSNTFNNYQAVVLGKVTKKEVKEVGNLYLTEYKIKTKKWLFKKPEVKEKKVITINVLGAELSEKGLVIRASTSPDFIPMKKDVIFLLEKTKLKQNDVFTISKNGIIYDQDNVSLSLDQIEELFEQLKEI